MRKTNSLKFIPDNPKKFDGFISCFSSSDSAFMTLDEKIKKNPLNREKFRCEAKISTGYSPNRRHRRWCKQEIKNQENEVSNSDNSVSVQYTQPINNNASTMQFESIANMVPSMLQSGMTKYDIIKKIKIPEFNNGNKEYIKNLTPIEIIMDFHPNSEGLKQGQRPPKPKTIKAFIGKWEIRGYENHYVMESLYKSGKIMDVTKEQYDYEMNILKKIDQIEEQELAARAARAEQYRRDNPHAQDGGLRRIGAGGIDIIIPDSPVSGMVSEEVSRTPSQEMTSDGNIIRFDTSGDGTVNPRTEISDHEALVNSIIIK